MALKFANFVKIMREAAGDPIPAGGSPPPETSGSPPIGGGPPDMGMGGMPPMGGGAPPSPPPMGGGGGMPPMGGGDMGMPPMGGDNSSGGNTKPVNVKTHNVWDVLKKYLHKLKSGEVNDDEDNKEMDKNVK